MTTALADLIEDPQRVAEVPDSEIPPLLALLASLQSSLAARLLTVNGHHRAEHTQEDRLLRVTEAAALLKVSPDWLYRRAKTLPFTVRVGRHLRFSSRGISRYIRQRQGR